MQIIRKNPKDIIPDIMEKDCIKHVVIVVQQTRTNTYIGIIERNAGRSYYQSRIFVKYTNETWVNIARSTLINVLISEYNLFEYDDSNIRSDIFILENKTDVDKFIEMFHITNDYLLNTLMEKFQ